MIDTRICLQMEGITKRFPGVLANNEVNFEVREGEIHSLLGENGAGKTTLMCVLAGIYRPDAGSISINGEKVSIANPADAIRLGIGMVHQNFMLVNSYSVAENITLGLNKPRFWINRKVLESEINSIGQQYDLQIDPKAKIWQLSVGEQQRVEILRMLHRGTKILIMDEPTAVLTPQEVQGLFTTLRKLALAGHSVVFISHKLEEVMSISDRITVLRKGNNVDTVNTKQTNPAKLVQLMVGREISTKLDKPKVNAGPTLLTIRDLSAISDKGVSALKKVSLTLCGGEIIGIAGVAGNGQRELAEVINGLRPSAAGQVLLEGFELTHSLPRRIIDAGVAYIPEDRKGIGTVANLPLTNNLFLKRYRSKPYSTGLLLNVDLIKRHARDLVKRFDIAAPNLDIPAKLLSGGNLQKLIIAREISDFHKLVVAAYPTRGLDISATEFVHQLLLSQRKEGVGILLISEDLDELFMLSDLIVVMYEGRIMGNLRPEESSVEEVGLLMAGKNPHDRPPEAKLCV